MNRKKIKFQISVEKRMYCTGTVNVTAHSSSEALNLVSNQINNGELKTTDIQWDEPVYEDLSFETTGDVN